LVKILPRLASVAAFLCLMEDHFECPDMVFSLKDDDGILTQTPGSRNIKGGRLGRGDGSGGARREPLRAGAR